MRFLIFILSISWVFTSCFTQRVLDSYNGRPLPQKVTEVSAFGYNDNRNLVVNFSGAYLGDRKEGNYHFELDLNGVLSEYSRATSDSELILPDKFQAERIYEIDHDYIDATPGILTIEIRKEYIRKGFFKGNLIPLEGETEIFSNGKSLSFEVFDGERLMNPTVLQFSPEVPWQSRGKKREKVSFVLQPTYKRKTETLLLVPVAIVGDIGTVILQVLAYSWAFN